MEKNRSSLVSSVSITRPRVVPHRIGPENHPSLPLLLLLLLLPLPLLPLLLLLPLPLPQVLTCGRPLAALSPAHSTDEAAPELAAGPRLSPLPVEVVEGRQGVGLARLERDEEVLAGRVQEQRGDLGSGNSLGQV